MIARAVAFMSGWSDTTLILAYLAFVAVVLIALCLFLALLTHQSATWKHDQWGRKWEEPAPRRGWKVWKL